MCTTFVAAKVNLENETGKYRDYRFTKWMTKNIGFQVMPLSVFYSESHKHLGENYVRLCFIKVIKLDNNENIIIFSRYICIFSER